MHEVVFIGAGPQCLTTLLRLLDPQPDDSIDEKKRGVVSKSQLYGIQRKQHCDLGYRGCLKEWLRRHVLVVDPSGCWLSRWRQQFRGLSIGHLRSTSALHVDPHDAYGLLHYAEAGRRQGEVLPLRHISRDKHFHGPFHVPSSALFEDHCYDCMQRYCVEDIVRQGQVTQVEPVFDTTTSNNSASNADGAPVPSHYLVHLADGSMIPARRVVVGIGSTNRKRLPAFCADLEEVQQQQQQQQQESLTEGVLPPGTAAAGAVAAQAPDSTFCTTYPKGHLMHAWDIAAAVGGPEFDRLASSPGGSSSNISPTHSSCSSCTELNKIVACPVHHCSDASSTISSSSTSSSRFTDELPGDGDNDSSCGCSSCCSEDPQEQAATRSLPAAVTAAAAVPSTDNSNAFKDAPCTTISNPSCAVASSSSKRTRKVAGATAEQLRNGSEQVTSPEQARAQAAARLLQRGLVRPGERVLLVGGGLTSAHLIQLAAAAGAAEVVLLLRGSKRVKQFDVDLPYMGRLRGESLKAFRRIKGWAARLKVIREALQGGSLTPEAERALQPLLASGQLTVREHNEVLAADWDWQQQQWAVTLQDGIELAAHRIWLATGSSVDLNQEPLMAPLVTHLPINIHCGLPALQPSLEWRSGSGLFLLGAYAALQLGPGALNLAGARTGSRLVVDELWKVAGKEGWLTELRRMHKQHLA